VNSAISGEENPNYVIMMIFTVLILVVNAVAVIGLLKGRSARSKLVEGLLRIYKDNEVEGYYDRSLLESYQTRYLLFMLVVVSTGLVAMIVPYTI
jgi:hypothetical protein